MKIEQFKRIFKQDFEEQYQELMETLGGIINDSLEKLHQAMNNRISLKDNIYCNLKSVEFNVDSNGIPIQTVQFTTTLGNRAEGISVINIENITNPTVYPTAGVTVVHTENDRVITIQKVTGLPVDNKFRLKLVVYG